MTNSNHMSISRRLAVTTIRKKSYKSPKNLLSLGSNFGQPTQTLTPGRFFSKSNGFLLGSDRRPPPKMKLIASIFFLDTLLTDMCTDKCTARKHGNLGWGGV